MPPGGSRIALVESYCESNAMGLRMSGKLIRAHPRDPFLGDFRGIK
jgi:hypothetical protein